MSKKVEPESEIGKVELGKLIELVHKHTGISMTDKKVSLLQGRLRSRLRELELEKYDEYISRLASQPSEVQEFINRVTTNETFFFRTPRVWSYFRDEFLPKHPTSRPLNLWSAASSSGEEAYSMAMSCFEQKARTPGLQFQIQATDISTEVLEKATQGYYDGRSYEDLKTKHPALFKKYMVPTEKGATANADLKAKITFAPHNLYVVPKKQKFYDVVFLRNVLIYFTAEDQEKVIENIGLSLTDGGILIIGESDSLSRLKTNFEFLAPLIYKKSGQKG